MEQIEVVVNKESSILPTAGKYCEKNINVIVDKENFYNEGYNDSIVDFWTVYTENGARTDYYYGFYQRGWTDETFKPAKDLTPTRGQKMFS
jgi:hypothetical protein